MDNEWLTKAEYARRHGISRPAVTLAVQAGRLETNGKSGRDCRVRGALAESVQTRIAPARRGGEASPVSLAEAKLEKLQADVKLQHQRIQENIAEARRSYVALILEEYVRAFAPFKARLTELRLTDDQLSTLGKLVEECLRSFEQGVSARLAEK